MTLTASSEPGTGVGRWAAMPDIESRKENAELVARAFASRDHSTDNTAV